jgi:hypothetical protein
MVCMRTKPVLVALLIITLGIIATLVSGFYEQNLSNPGPNIYEIGYGFPLVWHGHSWVVFPSGVPPALYWYALNSFFLDTVFWCFIFAALTLILFGLLHTRK